MNASFLIMLAAIGGLTFWMQRSQKKQQAKRMDALSRLSKGNRVVTIGGLHAVIDEVNSEEKTVVLDVDGVYLTFDLAAIRTVLEDKVVEEKLESPVSENKEEAE